MTGDPLQRVLRLRQQAVERARLALAQSLKAEAEALDALHAVEGALSHERAADPFLGEDAWFGDALAHGRDRLRQRLQQAKDAVLDAQNRSAASRDEVARARSDAEVVATLLAERRAAAQARQDDQARHLLDDVARARFVGRATAPDA